MDKAIIFSVFDFVSFHVCKALLDKGIEVEGIHVYDKTTGRFLEEKRLEIGRNANFSEHDPESYHKKVMNDATDTAFIISLYDLYMLYKEDVLTDKTISNLVNPQRCKVLTFLIPAQFLTNSMEPQVFEEMKTFMSQISKSMKSVQYIYLPTLYGQWQPETFLFQHAILEKMNHHNDLSGTREDRLDAVYVEEAAHEVLKIIETKKGGKYLFQSGLEGQWEKCAAYLNLPVNKDELRTKVNFPIDDSIKRIIVKSNTSVHDSIKKQIQQVERLFSTN
jgi:hypothetical protein